MATTLNKNQFKFIKNNFVHPLEINSLLFVPAIKDKFYDQLLKLRENRPDCVIFDLEDSIETERKDAARDVLLTRLSNLEYKKELFKKYKILIRINPCSSKWFKDDIIAVKKIKPDILMTSKTETTNEIKKYKNLHPQLLVLVETLTGISNLDDILKEMRKTDLFVLGYEDLSADLFIERPGIDLPNPLTHILFNSIITARRYNINMLDSVSRVFKTKKDLAKFKTECMYTANLNLTGKLAIHPNQISIINTVFKTQKKKIKEEANKIITIFNELTDGSFVTIDENSEMIDTPSYKMARKIKNSEKFSK